MNESKEKSFVVSDFQDALETSAERDFKAILARRKAGYTHYECRKFPNKNYNKIQLYIHDDFNADQKALLYNAVTFMNNFKEDSKTIASYLDGLKEAGVTPSEPRDPNKPFLISDGSKIVFGDAEEKLKIHICFFNALSEAGVIAGNLYIDYFDEAKPTSGRWRAGNANLDYYTDNKYLRIRLNRTFVNSPEAGYNGQSYFVWSGFIAHEIMHNLGWDHKTDPESNTYIGRMTRYFSDFTVNQTLCGD